MKLSEMKSSPDVGRPERTFQLCVSGKLTAELDAADQALFDAEQALAAGRARQQAVQEGEEHRPGRLGRPVVDVPALEKAAADAAAACDAIRERMRGHTIDLALRAWENSEWRQWANAHPARDEETDPAGWNRDRRWAGGFCDIDALIADLGNTSPSGTRWIIRYGDEEPEGDSWAFILANAAPGDLTKLASILVGMHEQEVDLGKSRLDWLAGRQNAPTSR